jgi:hypothetical protein
MFWNVWSLERHSEQKRKYNRLSDEYIHGKGPHWLFIYTTNQQAASGHNLTRE